MDRYINGELFLKPVRTRFSSLKNKCGFFIIRFDSGMKFVGYSKYLKNRIKKIRDEIENGERWTNERDRIKRDKEYDGSNFPLCFAYHTSILVQYTDNIKSARQGCFQELKYAANVPEQYYNNLINFRTPKIKVDDTHFVDYREDIKKAIKEFEQDIEQGERVMLRIDCLGQSFFYKTKSPAKRLKDFLNEILIPQRKVSGGIEMEILKKKKPTLNDFFYEILPIDI